MKAKDLIEYLKEFDPEMHVVVDGYESGYDNPHKPKIIKVLWNAATESGMFGSHAEATKWNNKKREYEEISGAMEVILLERP